MDNVRFSEAQFDAGSSKVVKLVDAVLDVFPAASNALTPTV